VGPFEKGNEKYYQALEKLTGITKANYNDKIWELINNENKDELKSNIPYYKDINDFLESIPHYFIIEE